MAKLYIIGNGFDLHYGLKTSPSHFEEILKTKFIYNKIENAYDVISTYGVEWSEYEQSLADFDLDEIENQNLIEPDYLSDRESDRDGGILNMEEYLDSINDAVNDALKEMIKVANEDAMDKILTKPCQIFHSGDVILSFNYTSTIEILFNLPRGSILHIHGFYEDNEQLVFGYKTGKNSYESKLKTTLEDGDFYVDQQRNLIYEFYKGWEKDIQINVLIDFLKKCQKIDEIVVLGHSMGEVDSVYMEKIEDIICPRIWHVSYHNCDDIVKTNLTQYSFASKTHLFQW